MVLTIYPSHFTFTRRHWTDTILDIIVYRTDEFWLVDVFAGNCYEPCIDIIKAFPVCGIQEQWLPNTVHKTYIKEDDKYLLDLTGYVCQSSKADEITDALKPHEQSDGELLYRFPSNLDWMSKSTKTEVA